MGVPGVQPQDKQRVQLIVVPGSGVVYNLKCDLNNNIVLN